MIIKGKDTSEITVLIRMQSDVNSQSNLYVIERIKDIIPEGIAASIIETLNSKSTNPKNETMKKEIIGNKANFIIEVNIIMFLERLIPAKSMDIPKDSMIKGIAPFPK